MGPWLKVNWYYDVKDASPTFLNLSSVNYFRESTIEQDGPGLLGTVTICIGQDFSRLDKESSEVFLKAFKSDCIPGFFELSHTSDIFKV